MHVWTSAGCLLRPSLAKWPWPTWSEWWRRRQAAHSVITTTWPYWSILFKYLKWDRKFSYSQLLSVTISYCSFLWFKAVELPISRGKVVAESSSEAQDLFVRISADKLGRGLVVKYASLDCVKPMYNDVIWCISMYIYIHLAIWDIWAHLWTTFAQKTTKIWINEQNFKENLPQTPFISG